MKNRPAPALLLRPGPAHGPAARAVRLPVGPGPDPGDAHPLHHRGGARTGGRHPRVRPAPRLRGTGRSAFPDRVPGPHLRRARPVHHRRGDRSHPHQDGPPPPARLRRRQGRTRRRGARELGATQGARGEEGGEGRAGPGIGQPAGFAPRPAADRERGHRASFDWPTVGGVTAKFEEEWAELREAIESGGAGEGRGGIRRPAVCVGQPLAFFAGGPGTGPARRHAKVRPALRVPGAKDRRVGKETRGMQPRRDGPTVGRGQGKEGKK
ncbi:MAG: hypothetical protein MZU91_06985 [Desulfosudis oleivorans]|nr:hypothetical protein [Desulfosudis oleivorans]